MNTTDFVIKNNISINFKKIDSRPDGLFDDKKNPFTHYNVIINYNNNTMKVFCSMGRKYSEPKADEVLNCLASEASGLEGNISFENWASDLGYDTNSIKKAKIVFNACIQNTKKLKTLLGNVLFDELVYHTERL